MKVGILGSGSVGRTLGAGLIKLGHEVKIGTRDIKKEELQKWVTNHGSTASLGSFAETASYGEVIFLCTLWAATESILSAAGQKNFAGKIVVDVTNPLDFSKGAPPKLAVNYPMSGGELVQNWLPQAQIVKAFNIVTANIMIHARLQEGTPDLFIAGNHEAAKKFVTDLASQWGWASVNDLGDITNAYWLETFAMLWIYFGFKNNHWTHAFKLLRK